MDLSRRAAVLSTGAALLAASAGPASAAPAWAAHHGMSADEYQAMFNQLTGQGYRLTHVDGYEVNGAPQFAAIWVKTSGPAWVAHHNLSPDQYQQMFDQLGAQGYRLTRVSGYAAGGSPLYAGIWVQSSGPAYVARHGMSAGDYQAAFDQMTGQGYRLAWVSAFGLAGQAQFAAIWEKAAGPAWIARHGMSADAYQAEFNADVAQGYRLQHVCGYSTGGPPLFAAIFDKSGGPAWQARHDMTSSQYQANFSVFNTRTGQLQRVIDVSGYQVGGQALYAAIWVTD